MNRFNQIYSHTQTITEYEKKVLKKGKKALYLVLRQKTFSDKIIDELEIEIERKFKNFLMDIAPKLKNIKLEDKENGLKYILIKGLINILNQMLNERMIILSDNDRNIVNSIFEEKDDEKLEDEKVENPANNYPNSQFPGMKKTPSCGKKRSPYGMIYGQNFRK